MRGIGSASENARTSVSTTPMPATIELRSPSGSPEAVAGAVACGRGRGTGAPVPGPRGGGGVGVGGARPPGGTAPTIALGWMLRDWVRDREGRASPDRQPADGARGELRAGDAQAVRDVRVGREREARVGRQGRAHGRDRTAARYADLAGGVREVPGREEVVGLVA